MDREYWNPEIETMEVEKLKEIQWQKMRRLITYAYTFSSFYRDLYDKAGMKPEDIKSLEDINKIPIWRKDDIRELMEETQDPFGGLLTHPLDKVEYVYSSSGTTGMPNYSPRSRSEYQLFSEIFARYLWMAGLRPGGFYYYGGFHFHGAIGIFTVASSKIGAAMCGFIPHPMFAPRNLHNILFLKPTVISGVPDILYTLGEEAIKKGIDPKNIFPPGANVVVMGELVTSAMKTEMAERFGVNIYDLSCLSEHWLLLNADCRAHKGNHFYLDAYHVEAVDPDTGQPVGPGKPAEMVVTSLILEGTPILRFGSEDMGILEEEKCDCGRTHPRVRWMGRVGWRIKVRGKIVAPIMVQEIFERFPETREAHLTLLKEKVPEMDKLRIKAAYNERITTDPEGLKNRLESEIKQELGVDTEITWVKFEELPIYMHKIQRVIEA